MSAQHISPSQPLIETPVAALLGEVYEAFKPTWQNEAKDRQPWQQHRHLKPVLLLPLLPWQA